MICHFAFPCDAEKQNPFTCGGWISTKRCFFYNCLLWAFATAASAAEWFFVAPSLSASVFGGSTAMKKDILLRELPLGRRPHGPEAASRANRAVMFYSRAYLDSKAETIPPQREDLEG